ncbi:MAG: cell envelope biogenesis protein TolA [Pseudomonadota bacterium]|nr:cell envelope biogenesis protein TolA [Pseudomonadota bacterium]
MTLPENPGFAVSGGVHIGLLALALFSLSQSPRFDDTQESVPVEVLSAQQFNQIMKGEKTAAQVKPRQRAEKIAELPELNPQPSPSDAPKDVSAPPPPLKHQVDSGQAEPQEAPKPPEHGVASPPPRPAQESAKPAPKSEQVKQSVAQPPKLPINEEAEEATPEPAPPKPVEPPKKLAPKFKPDQLAKLLDQEKQKEKQKPATKPKSREEAAEPQQKFDLGDIAKFLNKAEPQRKQASGHELSQVASLGSPAASAAKMSPSLWDQLDGLLQEQYKRCWNFAGLGGQQKYIPEIHVQYTQDGSLIGQPVLLNPPSDPNLRALAESAMRAVRRCDPLRIPSQYQLYYDQWKGRIVRFDPEEML